MAYTFSEEAIERVSKTVQASQVLRDNLQAISQACLLAGHDEVVFALVTPDLEFGGTKTISRYQLRRYVISLERGSWHLVFSARTDVEEIEYRCITMGNLARARWEIMRRRVDQYRWEGAGAYAPAPSSATAKLPNFISVDGPLMELVNC